MPRRCVVTGCSANKAVMSKSFFRFPSDEELCKKWIKSLCNLELVKICETEGYNYLYKNKFVCCEHFDKKHFRNVNAPNQGLFDGAIPTLNLHLNMDTLISNIKEDDTLQQIIETKKKIVKKNVKIKTQTNENTTPTINNTENTEEIDYENIELSDLCKMKKTANSVDDIPLKQLFGDKIKLSKDEKESDKLLGKHKTLKAKEKTSDKDQTNLSNDSHLKFEQVFINNEDYTLDKIKTEKNNDPLRNKNTKLKKNNKRKNKFIKRKTKKLLKVVVAPKTIDDKELKITTQGPKKIIKVVVPPKSTDGNEAVPNKIIKVVLPKKTVNGTEINLEKDEINKILRLVSAPKSVDGKGIKLITQSAEVNRILKLASVPNGTHVKNIDNNNSVKTDVAVIKNIDIKQATSSKESGKILRKIVPPVDVNGRPIKLITNKIDSNAISADVSITDGQIIEKTSKATGNCKLANLVAMSRLCDDDDFDESLDNCTVIQPNDLISNGDSVYFNDGETITLHRGVDDNVIDINLFDGGGCVNNNEVSFTNVNNSVNSINNANLKEDESNPIAEELCKRIKHVIKQRLGDTNNTSSDSDTQECSSKKITKKTKMIGKKSKTKRKNCSCDADFHEKMISLWREEKELKRRLLTTQNMATRYKINNRKSAATMIELRKQIPEKKPPKPGHIIKTILPLDKVKEKNPRRYRFTRNLKSFALDLFYSSPLSYSILEKVYFLPSRKTLRNWLVHPKNTENDLQALDETNETVMQENNMEVPVDIVPLHDSMQIIEENIEIVPNEHIVSLDANMGVIDDNIENLQDNILLLL